MATLQLPLAVTAALLAMGSNAAHAAPRDPSAFIAETAAQASAEPDDPLIADSVGD